MLWQDQVYRPFGLGPEMDNGAVDALVSYGLRLPKRLLVAPFGGYGSGYGGRRMQFGARLGAVDAGAGMPVHVEFSGERYTREMGPADHRVTLFGIVRFGGRPAAASVGWPGNGQPAG